MSNVKFANKLYSMYNKIDKTKGGFMDNKFKSAIALGGFIIFVIIMGTFSLKEDDNLLQETNTEKINIQTTTINSGEEEKICVYIIGAVNKPGIIDAPKNSRLYEIVELAGGLTEDADKTAINLASSVNDEEKIIIPYKENTNENQKINQLYLDNKKTNSGKININTASIEELKTLTGIGQSTAEKIVKYRSENSKFQKIEDIKNVSGIGESKFDSIKDKIVVK